MKNRFLPIGSIVKLKNGQKEVMVTSYCIFPTGKEIKNGQEVEPERKMYEYGGCIYPEGIIESNTSLAWNHSDIEEIIFEGYENEDFKQMNEELNKNYDSLVELYNSGKLN